jgi:hypothetical protein
MAPCESHEKNPRTSEQSRAVHKPAKLTHCGQRSSLKTKHLHLECQVDLESSISSNDQWLSILRSGPWLHLTASDSSRSCSQAAFPHQEWLRILFVLASAEVHPACRALSSPCLDGTTCRHRCCQLQVKMYEARWLCISHLKLLLPL